uniref:hypothetical protein n=1 Tax=Alistipes onderdonkii TaxID=328813 RepID=UPI0040271530
QKNVRASAKGCPEPRNQSGEKRPASKPATHATGIRRTAGHSGFRGKSLPEQKKRLSLQPGIRKVPPAGNARD